MGEPSLGSLHYTTLYMVIADGWPGAEGGAGGGDWGELLARPGIQEILLLQLTKRAHLMEIHLSCADF